MFDFPSNPNTGDAYTTSGITYKYNGYGWVPQNSSGGSGGNFPEAPIDNVGYGRQNTTWTPVLMLSNDILDGGNF